MPNCNKCKSKMIFVTSYTREKTETFYRCTKCMFETEHKELVKKDKNNK